MKKLILLALTLILAGCTYNVNGIKFKKGDTKSYETKDYIIIYEYDGCNGFGQPWWKFKEIRNKNVINTDSI